MRPGRCGRRPSRLAPVAPQGDGKFVVIMDDKELNSYAMVTEPLFSSNSSILLYTAVKTKGAGEKTMVVNGKEEDVYNKLGIPIFSPDGNHYSYAASNDDDEWNMVRDGKAQKVYERVGIANFDKSSNHFAYTAFKDGNWFFVVDGHEGRGQFDSRKFPNAYLYSDAPGHFRLLVANRKEKNIEFFNLEVQVNN